MQRRDLLLATSASLVTVTAGCSSDDSTGGATASDDGGTTPSQTTGTSTASQGSNTVSRLEAAAAAIENANSEISAESDKFSDPAVEAGGGVDVRTQTVIGHLDDASAELDAAEEGATDSQQETIDAARQWVSLARALIDFLDVFADGYTDFTSGLTYLDAERYGDAADSFQTAGETFSDADSQLTIVRDRNDSLMQANSNYFEDVDLNSIDADIEELSSLLATFIPMSDGLRQLNLGFEDFLAATTDLENERYTDAESTYQDAEDHFTTAESTFMGLESSAPNSVRSDVIELTCYASALKEGAGHYAAGSGYYADENFAAGDDEFTQGEESLNQCNFDA